MHNNSEIVLKNYFKACVLKECVSARLFLVFFSFFYLWIFTLVEGEKIKGEICLVATLYAPIYTVFHDMGLFCLHLEGGII